MSGKSGTACDRMQSANATMSAGFEDAEPPVAEPALGVDDPHAAASPAVATAASRFRTLRELGRVRTLRELGRVGTLHSPRSSVAESATRPGVTARERL